MRATRSKSKPARRGKAASRKGDVLDKAIEKLEAETEPALPMPVVEAIEGFVEDTRRSRRAALAFLACPWPEMARKIETDRKGALAFACLAHDLGHIAKQYHELGALLDSADARLTAALCGRSDYKAITKEAAIECEALAPLEVRHGR